MFGEDNSYEKQGVPLRNAAICRRRSPPEADEQSIPVARTLTEPGDWIELVCRLRRRLSIRVLPSRVIASCPALPLPRRRPRPSRLMR